MKHPHQEDLLRALHLLANPGGYLLLPTPEELAMRLGWSLTSINLNLDRLRAQGELEFIAPAKKNKALYRLTSNTPAWGENLNGQSLLNDLPGKKIQPNTADTEAFSTIKSQLITARLEIYLLRAQLYKAEKQLEEKNRTWWQRLVDWWWGGPLDVKGPEFPYPSDLFKEQ